jgi:mRNA-decapping enzyme subunit 2
LLSSGLDDLCVRFIINLPEEELGSPERICFQIEEAQWFYEDFIRPLDPTLPSLNLRKFCDLIFAHCPLLSQFSQLSAASYSEFLAYKTRVPVRGAIMLNDDMSEVVLVKGWKKGAKWSFPRGKINKDEKDLDCAIREVYEETGYDIKAAGLVPDDEDVKSLDQTMREQHMRLFVFRGVPMDTYFEPRTRKEISKISWYKLADLPTLKKERHMQQHGINGEDSLKMSNFYMVAPFIRNLKAWIKQQRRQDKMQGKPVPRRHAILEEGEEADDTPAVEEPSADEAHMETTDVEDSGHMDRLLSNLRNSHKEVPDSVLPEVSTTLMQSTDLAAELKRMLSVGGPTLVPPQPVPQEKDVNPLMSLLRGTQPAQTQANNYSRPPYPQTPLDQISATPPQARTPHHNHPRPQPFSSMPPPPVFPYSPGHLNQGERYNPQGPRPFPQQPMPFDNGFQNQDPRQMHPQQQFPMPGPSTNFPGQGLQGPPPPMHQQMPKPWERNADFQSTPQYPQYNQPSVIPQASKLPPPKLTNHALSLLNVFKSPTPQTAAPANLQSHASQPEPASRYGANLPVPVQVPALSQMPVHTVQSSSILQPQATKPRNTQQDALLNLFRAPSTPAVPAGLEKVPSIPTSLEPVELSAQSSPQVQRGHFQVPEQQQHKLSMRHLPSLNTAPAPQPSRSPGLTSATVSGPLNAPDFATVKRRQQRPAELGIGEPASPQGQAPQNKQTQPVSILAKGRKHQQQKQIVPPAQTRTPPVPVHTVTNRTAMEAPQPFHPTSILRRPNQEIVNMMASSQSQSPKEMPPPPVPAQPKSMATALKQKADAPNEQKQTLLNLFGGGAMKPVASGIKSATATPPISALPGTTSGVGSPVSPLPSHAVLMNSKTRHGAGREDSLPISVTSNPSITMTANLNEKTRVSSVTSIPSDAGTIIQQQLARKGTEKTMSGPQTPSTPVDKNFLLGFLEAVAKTGAPPQGKRN